MKKTLCSLFVIIAICVLLLSACEKNGNTNEKGDCDMKYIDVVNSLVDLKALATAPQKGEGAYESSSYNKLSNYNATTVVYENWSQNWDEGNDAPRTDDGGAPKRSLSSSHILFASSSLLIFAMLLYISSL